MSRLDRAALVVAVLLVAGCPKPLPPTLTAATVKMSDLPEEEAELLKYADEQMKKDEVSAVENSLLAVDKAIGLKTLTVTKGDYEALWRGARACAWLAEEFTDKTQRNQFAHHGIEYAKAAVALEPKRVEGHYFQSINTGLSATTKTIGAYNMVPKVRDAAKAAIEVDEKFDYAGPLRLLGSVFTKAPPWPASIGDVDEGLKFLRRAVHLAPDYPHNHLLYGDALAADEKVQEAAKEYRKVLDAPVVEEYHHRLGKWKKEAAEALKKLGQNGQAFAPPM